jgi:hypothetical protein
MVRAQPRRRGRRAGGPPCDGGWGRGGGCGWSARSRGGGGRVAGQPRRRRWRALRWPPWVCLALAKRSPSLRCIRRGGPPAPMSADVCAPPPPPPPSSGARLPGGNPTLHWQQALVLSVPTPLPCFQIPPHLSLFRLRVGASARLPDLAVELVRAVVVYVHLQRRVAHLRPVLASAGQLRCGGGGGPGGRPGGRVRLAEAGPGVAPLGRAGVADEIGLVLRLVPPMQVEEDCAGAAR